jgi:hypothetical protein
MSPTYLFLEEAEEDEEAEEEEEEEGVRGWCR